jgi:hypothetical protein
MRKSRRHIYDGGGGIGAGLKKILQPRADIFALPDSGESWGDQIQGWRSRREVDLWVSVIERPRCCL